MAYQLTHAQLEEVWIRGGGSPDAADVAAAVAQAESGGCQYALAGPTDIRPVKACVWTRTNGENSCGFWQINLRAHPQYRAPTIFEQDVNASAAVAISSDGTAWEPWTTYRTGAYRKYLTGSRPSGVYTPPAVITAANAVTPMITGGWQAFSQSLGHDLPTALRRAHVVRSAAVAKIKARSRVRHHGG